MQEDQVRPCHLVPSDTVLREKMVQCVKCGEIVYDISRKKEWSILFTRDKDVYNNHAWRCEVCPPFSSSSSS